MIDKTIYELNAISKTNLCYNCLYKQPECEPDVVIWGDGNDNVIICSQYSVDKQQKDKIGDDRLNEKECIFGLGCD